ncbi:class I SAM-dependent methyltransferase [Nitrosovibrio tenuis]|uniref:Methyltransferase domain-containing protein n=1 Tax=Nitrosovibrio tenuis TaxID=1233 RepID=A0A1H7I840_9PROT|nr:class I SAM-dependent methyltransferase [Nitrosovibrio tenuis]SEK58534.1 Methyltransferase domain-containing protein [Nitrosovibrio tenuis]
MNEIKISDYLKDNYEDYYEEGDSEWRRLGALGKTDNIVSLCSNLPRSTILEIGAGEGSILKRLSELHFGDELYALEISSSGIETIKAKEIPQLAECKIFDGYHVPYDNDRFDIAIMSHVIEHVEYPRQLLYEASRVARYVFIEVPLEDTIRLSSDFVFDRVGHINFYSPKTIRRLVQSCNLRVLGQITTNPPRRAYTYEKGRKGLINYYTKEVLRRMLPRLATELFTYHGALVCERKVSQ